jgi:hypothetical protein
MDDDKDTIGPGELEEPANPQQAAAQGRGHKQDAPQDETENEAIDTDQHSDAPGPTGTG